MRPHQAQELRVGTLGQPRHVDRAVPGDLGNLHRIEPIINRRSRGGQVLDLIYLYIKREGHVMTHKFKVCVTSPISDLLIGVDEKVVDEDRIVAFAQ